MNMHLVRVKKVDLKRKNKRKLLKKTNRAEIGKEMVILNLQILSNFGPCLVGFGDGKNLFLFCLSMHCAVCIGARGIDLRVMIDIL